jgi:hypothetical protein
MSRVHRGAKEQLRTTHFESGVMMTEIDICGSLSIWTVVVKLVWQPHVGFATHWSQN